MVLVDKTATVIRDYLTTVTEWLAIGTSTAQSIETTSETIEGEILALPRASISYPTIKQFEAEFLVDANSGNDNTIRRIALKETSTTTVVVSLSNVPTLAKNDLIELVYNVTLQVINS